jgi:Fe-S oxidoreductase
MSAYAFGLMYWWARGASHMPRIVNFITQTPGLRTVVKRAATIAPQRRIPPFAQRTFRSSFRRRTPRNAKGPDVLLWPDTWNNHFHPNTALAAVEVLEAAGFHVTIPRVALCCGRPLYDYGMLGLARKLLLQILTALREPIRAGTPLVGLEPSCISVFRDELVNLLHGNDDAARLSKQSYLLSEFLVAKAPHFSPPTLASKALVHGHCHHKSVLRFHDEEKLIKALGLDYAIPDSGCCGMAGGFGFEKGAHYDVSIACGERVLLPEIRKADADTLIVTDGFSCREQIAQTTNRRAVHLADVLKLALDRAG